MNRKTFNSLMVLFLLLNLIFITTSCYGDTYSEPKKEYFDISIKPIKNNFNSKSDEVILIWKITLKKNDSISETDRFWIFPLHAHMGTVIFSIVNKNTSENIPFKYKPGAWIGESIEVYKNYPTISGVTTFEHYDIWDYNVSGEKEFYLGDFEITINYPFGTDIGGKFHESNSIMIENISYQVMSFNDFITIRRKLVFYYRNNLFFLRSVMEIHINIYPYSP